MELTEPVETAADLAERIGEREAMPVTVLFRAEDTDYERGGNLYWARMDNMTADDLLGVWECLRNRWDRDESVARLAAFEPDADTLRALAERAWDLADVAINEHRPEAREIYAEWGDDLKRVADRVDPVEGP